MTLSLADQALLNSFSDHEPALQRTAAGTKYAERILKLGDVLANLSNSATVKATYDVAISGTVGAKPLNVKIPAGAIITDMWTDAETVLASSGSATLAISAGATALKTATAFDDATLVGLDKQTVTLVKLSVESELTVTVAAAALTAGKVNIFVKYLK